MRVNIPGQPDGEPDDVKDDEPHPAGLRCYRIADAIRYRAPGQRPFLQFADCSDVACRSRGSFHISMLKPRWDFTRRTGVLGV
jgi:hypothetical protein